MALKLCVVLTLFINAMYIFTMLEISYNYHRGYNKNCLDIPNMKQKLSNTIPVGKSSLLVETQATVNAGMVPRLILQQKT